VPEIDPVLLLGVERPPLWDEFQTMAHGDPSVSSQT
jgi:hypothetical protein